MKALLINPWVYDFKAFDFWNKPVGLLMVASILKKLGAEISYIDCMDRSSPYFNTNTKTDIWGRGKYLHEVVEKPEIFKKVPRFYKRYGMPRTSFLNVIEKIDEPDVILVTSTMTYWYLGVFDTIKILRKRFPRAKILLGGIYATLCNKHAKEFSGADTVIKGPAETKLLQLLKDLGLIKETTTVELGNIGPDYTLYSNMHYAVIFTSRGCPFDCTYCATKILCRKFNTLPNELIINQLDYLAGKTKNIAFFDDALLYNKNFAVLMQETINKKFDFNFHASNGLHCRYIDEDIAKLMFNANFKTMYLSLETTNPEVQKQTGNKVNTEEFINAVNILTKVGFAPEAIHTYLLYGMPKQNNEEIIDAIKLCHGLGVHPHLCEFSPIPHTKEFEKTGFNENTDPLYHNNLFYTWYYPEAKPDLYRKIKRLLSQRK